jgi:hypothetical protein
MSDLLSRIFLNFRSSLDAVAFAIIAWLSSQGVELSDANRGKITGLAALIALSVWKLFSKDAAPEPEK